MFIKLENPTALRREILKTALDATSLVKYFSSLKEMNKEKVENINNLKSKLEELVKATNTLEKRLPLPEEEKQSKKEKISPKNKDTKIKSKSPVHLKEEDSVTKELEDIERKLRSL